MAFDDVPKIHVTIERKLNTGNYESASVSMGISQLPFDANEDTIRKAMETQQLAFKLLAGELRDRIAKIRGENRVE